MYPSLIIILILSFAPLHVMAANDDADGEEIVQTSFEDEGKALNITFDKLAEFLKNQDANYKAGNVSREEMLREAQRAWVTFRDKNCNAESQIVGYGGTLTADVYQECMAFMTLTRRTKLENLYNSLQGE